MTRRATSAGPYIRGDLEVAVEPADGDDIELQFMVYPSPLSFTPPRFMVNHSPAIIDFLPFTVQDPTRSH